MCARGVLYKLIAQTVIIYESKSCVVKVSELKVLEGFYHQVALQIMVITDRHTEDGYWEYPLVDDSL